MKRFLSSYFNFFLAIAISFGLAGCVTNRLPIAETSPWEVVELSTQANPLDLGFLEKRTLYYQTFINLLEDCKPNDNKHAFINW